MKLVFCILFTSSLSFSWSLQAETEIGFTTIDRITTWKNGNIKAYVKEGELVNGKENCTATDNSVAIDLDGENSPGQNNILSLLMDAQANNKKVKFFVNGCCVEENGKQSPCLDSVVGY